MIPSLQWHFHGFPEDPWVGTDPASTWQQVRGRYLLARSKIQDHQWTEARDILGQITLPPQYDVISPLIIMRAQALVAHYDHRFSEAIGYYEAILQDWQAIAPDQQAAYLDEDAAAFTCSIYRQLAQAWFYMGAAEVGRTLLEEQAQPLVDRYFPLQPTPLAVAAPQQTECNWRLLRLYIPWMTAQCISWQVRFSAEPSVFEDDLFVALEAIGEANRLSAIMPEGHAWTQAILTTAAEMLTQRSLLATNRPMQAILCLTAREHLERIQSNAMLVANAEREQLWLFVLRLPWYELDFAERRARDALDAADDLLDNIRALRKEAQGNADPGFQLFTSRCTWLLGQIEMARQEFDPLARSKARDHLLDALQLLPPHQEFTSLNQRGIEADLRRLD